MARYREGHRNASHDEIVHKAAARFRKEGLAGVGVRPIMADAGLTHGGFYAHFPSRSDLISAAIQSAFDGTLAVLGDAARSAGPGGGLKAIVDAYLHPIHRVYADQGCAAAALASEIPRESASVRSSFTAGVDRIVDLIASQLPAGGSDEERKARASAVFSLMLGSLQMMRVAPDEQEAERHMRTGRVAAIALASMPWPAP